MVRNSKSQVGGELWRIRLVLGIFSLILVIVIGRLFFLQVLNHDHYVQIAAKQHWTKYEIPASRGRILVKDPLAGGFYPLADNQKLNLIFAAPEEINNKEEAVNKIASAIEIDKQKTLDLLIKNHTYVPIKHLVSYQESEKVRGLGIKGIYVQDEDNRYYPEGTMAAQVLGFVNNESEGKYGIEQYFDEELTGVPGQLRAEKDVSGYRIGYGDSFVTKPKDGKDVVLTINRDIQKEAEKLIKKTVEKFKAENGSMIIMDPRTGEIIAMTNYPTFDPNKYQDVNDYRLFRNSAITDSYEPGSIFKAITVAIGLDDKKIEPDTKYEDTGSVKLSGRTIMNSDRKANGIVTMTQALEKSLNTGMVYILNAIGKTKFFEYIHRFNFGKATGIEQIGEGQGFVSDNLNLPAHTVATMTFGQSISVTPIQMITAFSSIANNGIMVKPTLIRELIDPNTGKSEKTKPVTVGRVMSEENAQKEKAMLRSVILKGHGKKAGVAGYKIGGKTGTAQVPRQDGKGYETNKNIGSFIGIGPLDNPRFVIMSKIDYPKGVQWAETTAAPVVGEMFDFLFKYYQIPPTEKVK